MPRSEETFEGIIAMQVVILVRGALVMLACHAANSSRSGHLSLAPQPFCSLALLPGRRILPVHAVFSNLGWATRDGISQRRAESRYPLVVFDKTVVSDIEKSF